MVLVMVMGVSFVYFQVSPAYAHSTLIEMEPPERVVAETPPETLQLRFNEPIEHDLAMITVYDWNAKPVFTGNPDGDTEKAPLLEFSLPALKQGTYTVKWNVVSADGHPVSGSYYFSVGKPTEGGVTSVQENASFESGLILSRIITEGLLLVGAGLFWFGWLAERRQFPSLDAMWKKGRRLVAFILILGVIAELMTYSLSLPPGIIQVMLNGRWDLLLQFPFILMLGVQTFFLLLLFIPGMVRGWYLVLWAVLAITPAFGGHVWGMENQAMAMILRSVHQITIAFWLGSLAYLILLVIWQKKQEMSISWKKFRPFFVRKMMVASALVILSGVSMVYLQTGVTAVFFDWKTWSLLVIVKVILTLVMLSLALFQTLKWKKTIRFTTDRFIRSEWIIGLFVIAFGVWMSQIAYPIAIKSYEETLMTDEMKAEVKINELTSGDQRMTTEISELDGKYPEVVRVEVSMPAHDMGSGTMVADQEGQGSYSIDLPFTMPGTWLLEITATYPGGENIEWQDDMFIAGEGS